MISTSPANVRAVLLAVALVLFASACGSSSSGSVNASYTDELDEQAAQALGEAPQNTENASAAPADESSPAPAEAVEPAQDVATSATPAPVATVDTQSQEAAATATPVVVATPASASEPAATQVPATAAAQQAPVYDGVLPRWFSIPAGFTPTDAQLDTGDIDVLTIAGDVTTSFAAVCAQFETQASTAGLPLFAGTCDSSSVVYGTNDQSATAQSFGRSNAEFVFIGFELVPGGSTDANQIATAEATTPSDSTSVGSGIFPAWYQPPAAVQYVSHRDNASGERRVQTNLIGADYIAVCNDFRAQADRVGLLPTTTKQCDDPIISWTVVAGQTGASAEIQQVDGLSYEVLFVFDAASMRIAGNGAASTLADTNPGPTEVPETDNRSSDGRVVPDWFQPSVIGTDLTHAVEDGTYQLVAVGEISAAQTFTQLCEEFERQAAAGGWTRVAGDQCGEDIFDGATVRDSATGFEAQVRNFRGAEITYSFEVAVGLTSGEITAIAFDPELQLLPPGFSLVPSDAVIALSEGIDDTGAYTSAIQVAGASGFVERCDRLAAQVPTAITVIGSCDPGSNLVSLRSGSTTILLEDDVYTFVTR